MIRERAWAWDREPPLPPTIGGDDLHWRCSPASDYWRTTEGIAPKHDGNAYLTPVDGDFVLRAALTAPLDARYDQLGLMVVASDTRWLKTGIERDGEVWLSAVHTNEESDWSRQRWQGSSVELRVARVAGTIEVSTVADQIATVFRILFLPGRVSIGPYACAPKGPVFEARATILHLAENQE